MSKTRPQNGSIPTINRILTPTLRWPGKTRQATAAGRYAARWPAHRSTQGTSAPGGAHRIQGTRSVGSNAFVIAATLWRSLRRRYAACRRVSTIRRSHLGPCGTSAQRPTHLKHPRQAGHFKDQAPGLAFRDTQGSFVLEEALNPLLCHLGHRGTLSHRQYMEALFGLSIESDFQG